MISGEVLRMELTWQELFLGLYQLIKSILFPFYIMPIKECAVGKNLQKLLSISWSIKTTIQGIPTSAYPTLAKRPKYSILDAGRIEKELQIEIPTWQESLKKCIQILKSDGSL